MRADVEEMIDNREGKHEGREVEQSSDGTLLEQSRSR